MKPTNQVSHGGGERIRHASAGEQTLLAWVTRLAGLPPESSAAAPAAVAQFAAARRLTHNQYNRTIRDLLGDDTRPARQFPAEDFVDGFNNQTAAQSVSRFSPSRIWPPPRRSRPTPFVSGTSTASFRVNPGRPPTASAPPPSSKQFGLRAYRRALTSAEQQAFAGLLLREARQQNEFLAGARIVVEAMLTLRTSCFEWSMRTSHSILLKLRPGFPMRFGTRCPMTNCCASLRAGKLTTPGEVEAAGAPHAARSAGARGY